MTHDPITAKSAEVSGPVLLPPARLGEEVALPDATRLAMLQAFKRYGPVLTELLIEAAGDILEGQKDFEPSKAIDRRLRAFAKSYVRLGSQMRTAMADLAAERDTNRALGRLTNAVSKLATAVTSVHGHLIDELQPVPAERPRSDIDTGGGEEEVDSDESATNLARHRLRFNGIQAIVENVAAFSQFGASKCLGLSSQELSRAVASVGFNPPFEFPRTQLVLPGQPFFIIALALSETFRTIRKDIIAGDFPRIFVTSGGNTLDSALQEGTTETAAGNDIDDIFIDFGPESAPSVVFELRIPHIFSFCPEDLRTRHRSSCTTICALASSLGVSVSEDSVEWIPGVSIADPSRVRFTFRVANGTAIIGHVFDPLALVQTSDVARSAREGLASGDILVPLGADTSRFLILDKSIPTFELDWIPRIGPIFMILQDLPRLGTSRLTCTGNSSLALELNVQPQADDTISPSRTLTDVSNSLDAGAEEYADWDGPTFADTFPATLSINANTLLDEGCGDTVSKLVGLGTHWQACLLDFKVGDLKAMELFFARVIPLITKKFGRAPTDLTIHILPPSSDDLATIINFQISVSGIPIPILGTLDLHSGRGRYHHPESVADMSLPLGLPEAFRAAFGTIRGQARLRPVNPHLLGAELEKRGFAVSERLCEEVIRIERDLLSEGSIIDIRVVLESLFVYGSMVWDRREEVVVVTFSDEREDKPEDVGVG